MDSSENPENFGIFTENFYDSAKKPEVFVVTYINPLSPFLFDMLGGAPSFCETCCWCGGSGVSIETAIYFIYLETRAVSWRVEAFMMPCVHCGGTGVVSFLSPTIRESDGDR